MTRTKCNPYAEQPLPHKPRKRGFLWAKRSEGRVLHTTLRVLADTGAKAVSSGV